MVFYQYYAIIESKKPVYGDITFSVDFTKENYSNSNSVTVFLNASWTGNVYFHFTNEAPSNGFAIAYLGNTKESLNKNISNSKLHPLCCSENPYLIQQPFGYLVYYLPFNISNSHPKDKIIWSLGVNASDKVPSGYYAYYMFSQFGTQHDSKQSVIINYKYIYI
jgi:hypothetical protein